MLGYHLLVIKFVNNRQKKNYLICEQPTKKKLSNFFVFFLLSFFGVLSFVFFLFSFFFL